MNYFLEHLWYVVCAAGAGLVIGTILGVIGMAVVHMVGVA